MTSAVATVRAEKRPISLPRRRAPRRSAASSPARMRRQRLAAGASGTVAIILTGLSLTHLAHGIAVVTSAAPWETWAMATGIDLGFLAAESAMLCAASEPVRRTVGRWAHPTVIASLTLSGVLNALAFAHGADGWRVYAASVLGLAVPALIYALARVAFTLATSGERN